MYNRVSRFVNPDLLTGALLDKNIILKFKKTFEIFCPLFPPLGVFFKFELFTAGKNVISV